MRQKILVLTGPTASGKSSLGIKISQEFNGEIINADSRQMYQNLPTLTAQPSPDDLKKAPHHLYGILKNDAHNTMNEWRILATKQITDTLAKDKLPILVGGSGLYINALTEGMSNIPPISEETKRAREMLLTQEGPEKLAKDLKNNNAKTPSDPQRLARAWDVLHETKKPIEYWHTQKSHLPPKEWDFIKILLLPERTLIHEKIEKRLHKMLNDGAIEEVQSLLKQNLPLTASAMKTIGVAEIKKYLESDYTKDEMFERICQVTRQYVKRQTTWFKHQFKADIVIDLANADHIEEEIALIRRKMS